MFQKIYSCNQMEGGSLARNAACGADHLPLAGECRMNKFPISTDGTPERMYDRALRHNAAQPSFCAHSVRKCSRRESDRFESIKAGLTVEPGRI